MKTKLIALCIALLCAPIAQSFACATCFGNYPATGGPPPPNVQHMAIAIWVMMSFIMSVLGGVGAFSFHLWRRANMPLEPHQELAEEDLDQYD